MFEVSDCQSVVFQCQHRLLAYSLVFLLQFSAFIVQLRLKVDKEVLVARHLYQLFSVLLIEIPEYVGAKFLYALDEIPRLVVV